LTSRSAVRGGALLLGIVVLTGLGGCTVTNATGPTGSTANQSGAPAGPKGSAPKFTAPKGSALKALDTIAVKGRAPNTGYSRAKFGPAWADTDHNGCDQRNDILRRDLTGETFKAKTHGCVVLTGTLADHYTGKTIVFSKASATAIQIDHVVALQNAWVTGAFQWSAAKRESLATDPLNLLAVDGPTNESKGSGDAATWLPRTLYRCAYVARQVAVKVKYGAWMTVAEKKAIKNILQTCPKQELPVATAVPLGDGGDTSSGATKPAGAGSGGTATVTAGAFCSPKGATGVSTSGTTLTCSSKNGDRARWRSS
jgi:hypothetical protein